jgi:hypothetical protein
VKALGVEVSARRNQLETPAVKLRAVIRPYRWSLERIDVVEKVHWVLLTQNEPAPMELIESVGIELYGVRVMDNATV